MRVDQTEDGRYVLVSDGTAKENMAVNVISEAMFTLAQLGEIDDETANDVGHIHETEQPIQNYVTIPGDEFALRSLSEVQDACNS